MLSYNVFRFLAILLCSTTVLTNVLKEKRQTSCSRDAYRCKNGQCIESFSVCDGAVDCNDGSDETLALCTKSSFQCPSYAFRCAYGACVNKKSKCDGKRDCADNSDELLPECNTAGIKDSNCSTQEFPCTSGQCVDRFSLCDGNKDCSDGSDETITQCIAISCPSFSFKCAYGACIEKVKKCDGKKDCADGSDEDPDLCRKPSQGGQPTPRPPPSRPEKGSCRLPQTPEHGFYDVMGCRDGDNSAMCRKVAGTSVSPSVVLRYHCDNGYILTDVSRNLVCINGTWDPKPPKCLKLCEGLESDSLDLSCSYRGERVDCHRPAHPGTIVHPNCRNAYHVQDPSSVFEHTTCGTNGRWAQQLFKCVPDCGIPNRVAEETLISFGTPTNRSEFPWHVGLYLKDENTFTQFCGGSIITERIVLTAAHCIYNDQARSKMDEKSLRVVVGKYRRSWDLKDKHEQRLEVLKIFTRDAYNGDINRYEQDIAILYVKVSIQFTQAVMPVCVDWLTTKLEFRNGTPATVVGWGLTENNVSSEVLQTATLHYYDFLACREMALASHKNFLTYLTYDKICAGRPNGIGVQKGDSGGGLTIPKAIYSGPLEQHYIYGVVSLKPTEMSEFAAFTNVQEHIKWIQSIRNALSRQEIANSE